MRKHAHVNHKPQFGVAGRTTEGEKYNGKFKCDKKLHLHYNSDIQPRTTATKNLNTRTINPCLDAVKLKENEETAKEEQPIFSIHIGFQNTNSSIQLIESPLLDSAKERNRSRPTHI